MRRLQAVVALLLLALVLAALLAGRPTALPDAAEPPPPPITADNAVALATVALPPPPARPAPEVSAVTPAPRPPPAPTAPPSEPAPAPAVLPLQPSAPPRLEHMPPPASATPPAPPLLPPAEDGRALLVLLEHGRGPQISIDWPGGSESRRLADRLARCHGMRVAVLDRSGRLWREADPQGEFWRANLDRYSGFLRVGAGDAGEAARIRRRHGIEGEPVRLFPRAVDAHLLAALRQAVGPSYGAAHSIRLRYRLDGGRVVLDAIRVDGQRRAGQVRLAQLGGCLG